MYCGADIVPHSFRHTVTLFTFKPTRYTPLELEIMSYSNVRYHINGEVYWGKWIFKL